METETDLDLGAMVAFSPTCGSGVSVKHIREPELGEGETRIGAGAPGARRRGGDGRRADGVADDRRSTSTSRRSTPCWARCGTWQPGAEAWLFNRLVGVRGGLSANTAGEGGTAWSVGGSAGSGGLFVDGFLTLGSDASSRWVGSKFLDCTY